MWEYLLVNSNKHINWDATGMVKLINFSEKILTKDGIKGNIDNFFQIDFRQAGKMKSLAVKSIKTHPFSYSWIVLKNIFYLNTGTNNNWYADLLVSKRDNYLLWIILFSLIHLINSILMVICLLGAIIGFWHFKMRSETFLILGLILYFTLMTSLVIFGYSRYRLPILPFYILLTVGFYELKKVI
jgi:hypothetical protein